MSIDNITEMHGDLNTSIGASDLRQSFIGKSNTIETGSLVNRLQNHTAEGIKGTHLMMRDGGN